MKEFEGTEDSMQHSNNHVGDLEAWDLSYYSEKLKQSKFDLSDEELRPWFPLPTVLKRIILRREVDCLPLRFDPVRMCKSGIQTCRYLSCLTQREKFVVNFLLIYMPGKRKEEAHGWLIA